MVHLLTEKVLMVFLDVSTGTLQVFGADLTGYDAFIDLLGVSGVFRWVYWLTINLYVK